ncbi:cyclic lactone autoinducer peptide [Clostridium sp. P21]|uniref:Cyclic lactone autoinducer peptide n=1 Tax=Clostridium muellerianum TaxID=2716538 RepID=A0A7Y0ED71_9CLOT|nr:cyclic lactone autoinducer peptide [Clostridium muellerianum]NMM61316.1 cyclic lactone autoinducer peptide [Clostridium muellerianum]
MKKGLEKVVANLSAKVLKSLARSTSASACYTGFYQPKEPKCLREK